MLVSIEYNPVSVLLAAIASMVLGWIWYGPLFGKAWTRLAVFSAKQTAQMKKGAGKRFAIEFVLSLLMSLALAIIVRGRLWNVVQVSKAGNAVEGLQAGAWIWLGFLLPLTIGGALWEAKPIKLVMIHAGFRLVQMIAMGAVLGWWA